jgi:pyrroline-5-carboxylate reductase
MKDKTIGFIGGGRVTRIFLEGWERINFKCKKIIVSDSNEDVLNNLKKKFPEIEVSKDNQLPAEQEIVFLALHPPVIGDFLNQIKSSLKKESILISLAPKFTIQKIEEALCGFNRIIRMNPNAPSIINEGFNPVTFSNSFSKSEKNEIIKFFSLLGSSPEVEENKIEAFAVITAMGPTYFWFQLYELKRLAEYFGLNEEDIRCGLTKMINGATETMFRSSLTAGEIMDLVPVKPIGEAEENIKEIYNTKLNFIFNKIKPNNG